MPGSTSLAEAMHSTMGSSALTARVGMGIARQCVLATVRARLTVPRLGASGGGSYSYRPPMPLCR